MVQDSPTQFDGIDPSVNKDAETSLALPLAPSANGRLSGKGWKVQKMAALQSQHAQIYQSKKWRERMRMTQKTLAIKLLQNELKDEKQAEKDRRKAITLQRKRATQDREREERLKAEMGLRKAARLRKRAGRNKRING